MIAGALSRVVENVIIRAIRFAGCRYLKENQSEQEHRSRTACHPAPSIEWSKYTTLKNNVLLAHLWAVRGHSGVNRKGKMNQTRYNMNGS